MERRKTWDFQMIKDLLNPTDHVRAIGRTTIMADAFIELAKENPEHPIPIFDHCQHHRAIHHILGIISTKIQKLNTELEKENTLSKFTIRVKDNTLIYTRRFASEILNDIKNGK